ncbi:Pput_2613-like deaminase [Actinoalloteichus cyanogriseus DSM 43889]|uniref:Pput_2613-like deaminase n=2 Tax=Actinoalloteichus cyanogriseus TaxID=2893586 RepID=A0ABT1JGI8_ACTCY|nr:Pput_2613-like deaminase [Actinoalloteichus caeruleus DSM 43889]
MATITNEGPKTLVDVSHTPSPDQLPGTVTATDEHPFWVDDHGRWTHATDLTRGDTLLTPTGDHTTITHSHTYPHHHRVHNLTIHAAHTYYVLAGTTPVLVHNTGGSGHMCDITATAPDGSTRVDVKLESGDMTPEEAALGYPNNSAFTHTEHRFSRMAGASTGPKVSLPGDPFAGKYPLSPGDAVAMRGQLPPCSRCKGAMNRMVRELGVSVTYTWDGAKSSGTWKARG